MSFLSGRRILLSASFPSGERGERFAPADARAIADAVTSVVRAVLEADGRLVFGAHPTISPLVLLVAAEYGREDVVEIFQSRFYERRVPEETLRLADRGFGHIHWTEDKGDKRKSLDCMRQEMMGTRPSAGVFIGGMEGVIEEFELLRSETPRFALAAPGGAALQLAEEWGPPTGFEQHQGSPRYPAVADAIVRLVSQDGQSW